MYPTLRLSDSISLPTYLIYLSILYSCLVLYVVRRADRQERSRNIALNLALIMMVAGFLGGRAMHVFYELPDYYQEDWTRAFQFWQGGFVFYGGFLTAFLGCLFYAWKAHISVRHWADFYAPVLAVGYGLGRISCFLAGCCYGSSCSLPWAVRYSWDYHQVNRHPVQIYAVIWELAVFAILLLLEKRNFHRRHPGALFSLWLSLHALGRLMMESFRDDFRGDFIGGLSISTWFSYLLLAVGVAGLVQLWKPASSIVPKNESKK